VLQKVLEETVWRPELGPMRTLNLWARVKVLAAILQPCASRRSMPPSRW